MTDSEIKKALECCINSNCEECPMCSMEDCNKTNLEELTLDLINRLQAEVERLKNAYKQCAYERDVFLRENPVEMALLIDEQAEQLKTAKAEAYKEFADKIYEKVGFYITETNDTLNKMLLGKMQGTLNRKHYLYGGLSVLYEINSMLNNLLKELVGEDNG